MGNILDSIWSSLTIPLSQFLILDLIAASSNAFNGALLSRRPTNYRHYTVVGVILLGIITGITGGVVRDVLLNVIPSPLKDPWYVILSIAFSCVALAISFRSGQRFRDGLFQIVNAFALPWFTILGVDKSLIAGLPIIDAIVIGVAAGTAGRFILDIVSGLTPKQFVRGEWFVGTAVLTAVVFAILYFQNVSLVPATFGAFSVGFVFRLVALYLGWEEPEPWEPPQAQEGEPVRVPWKAFLQKEFQDSKKPDAPPR